MYGPPLNIIKGTKITPLGPPEEDRIGRKEGFVWELFEVNRKRQAVQGAFYMFYESILDINSVL